MVKLFKQIKKEIAAARRVKSQVFEGMMGNLEVMQDEEVRTLFAEFIKSADNTHYSDTLGFFKVLTQKLSANQIAFLSKEEAMDISADNLVPLIWGNTVLGHLKLSEDSEWLNNSKNTIESVKDFVLSLILYLKSSKSIEIYFNHMEVLNNTTLIMNSSLNIDEVYKGFAEEIKKVIEFDRITVAVAENDKNIVVLGIATEMETKLSKGVVIPKSNTAPGWVIENKIAHIAKDIAKVRTFWEDEFLAEEGIRSCIRVPLWVKRKIIGTLNLNSKKPNTYGYKEKIFLEQVGRQIATAIQNTQLYSQIDKQSQLILQQNIRLSVFHGIAEVVGSSLDLDQTLNDSLQKVTEMMGTEAGAIFLVNDDTGQIELKVHQSIGLLDTRLLNESILEKVIKTGEPIVFVNGNENNCQLSKKSNLQTLAYLPLRSGNKVVGVMPIGATNKSSVTSLDWELLMGIGNQIGVALENAQLYQRIKHMAEFDGLTEVYNRRVFYRLIEKELSRAERHGLLFAVLMLDVDLFKEYNDQYGHLAGDEVLRHIAGTLKDNVREADAVARYGGEEFVVLATEATKDQAYEMAERIRMVIEKKGYLKPFPTISIGVAAYPEDGQELEELLRKADAAMYLAKQVRNKTVSYSAELFEQRLTKL